MSDRPTEDQMATPVDDLYEVDGDLLTLEEVQDTED